MKLSRFSASGIAWNSCRPACHSPSLTQLLIALLQVVALFSTRARDITSKTLREACQLVSLPICCNQRIVADAVFYFFQQKLIEGDFRYKLIYSSIYMCFCCSCSCCSCFSCCSRCSLCFFATSLQLRTSCTEEAFVPAPPAAPVTSATPSCYSCAPDCCSKSRPLVFTDSAAAAGVVVDVDP
eukprot:TRINITY_DN15770_c0_g1_i2.p1 TRINITY_DN15770_c0_g1~~TRINITY_DN15770_c0_g1_i2.p1  ORF type:complete len:183 (+),score=27.17 TRINITY_DN15770_c0_g1_i2:336-884(+)